jgi:hypothetical protein
VTYFLHGRRPKDATRDDSLFAPDCQQHSAGARVKLNLPVGILQRNIEARRDDGYFSGQCQLGRSSEP